jgi:hypothetical protein
MLKGSCVVSFTRYLDMNPGTSINSEEVASSIFLFEDCEWEFRLSLHQNYMFIPCLVEII